MNGSDAAAAVGSTPFPFRTMPLLVMATAFRRGRGGLLQGSRCWCRQTNAESEYVPGFERAWRQERVACALLSTGSARPKAAPCSTRGYSARDLRGRRCGWACDAFRSTGSAGPKRPRSTLVQPGTTLWGRSVRTARPGCARTPTAPESRLRAELGHIRKAAALRRIEKQPTRASLIAVSRAG